MYDFALRRPASDVRHRVVGRATWTFAQFPALQVRSLCGRLFSSRRRVLGRRAALRRPAANFTGNRTHDHSQKRKHEHADDDANNESEHKWKKGRHTASASAPPMTL